MTTAGADSKVAAASHLRVASSRSSDLHEPALGLLERHARISQRLSWAMWRTSASRWSHAATARRESLCLCSRSLTELARLRLSLSATWTRAAVGGNLLQRFRYGTEQQAATDPLVLQGERRKLLRDGKHDMTVTNGKQFFGPLGEPLIPSNGLALGTMSVAAGVIRDHAAGAMIAFLHVAAQSGSAAGADVTEGFPLLGRQGMPPLLQELLTMLAKDIGYLAPMFSHRLLPSPSGVNISRIARSSNGLGVACTLRSETWR